MGRARQAARLELVERDHVLRAWAGELDVVRVATPSALIEVDSHEWHVGEVEEAADAVVVVALGFPRDLARPISRGFAARAHREEARQAAAREALQGLAFLWDEEIPTAPPAPAPTPMFHLDYYLYPPHHEVLRAWMARTWSSRGHRKKETRSKAVTFDYVDWTPPEWTNDLCVVRAASRQLTPLVFGPDERGGEVHPIP